MADFAQTIATAYAVDGRRSTSAAASKEGKKLQQEVVRGVFGLLKKKF